MPELGQNPILKWLSGRSYPHPLHGQYIQMLFLPLLPLPMLSIFTPCGALVIPLVVLTFVALKLKFGLPRLLLFCPLLPLSLHQTDCWCSDCLHIVVAVVALSFVASKSVPVELAVLVLLIAAELVATELVSLRLVVSIKLLLLVLLLVLLLFHLLILLLQLAHH